jgi:protein O-GlcNAc transferase
VNEGPIAVGANGAAASAAGEQASLESLQLQLMRTPMSASLWHQLSSEAFQANRFAEAVAAATTATTLAPDVFEYRLALAGALHRGGDLARAINHYDIAVSLKPHDIGARLGLASATGAAGLFDAAAGMCRAVLEIDATNTAARSLPEIASSKRRPQHSAQHRATAERLFNEAARLEAAGQLAQAIELFSRVAQLMSGVPPLHYRIGCLLQDIGQAEWALSHYELAARLQADLFGAAHNAGKLAASFGLADRARGYLSQAHRLCPRDGIAMRFELLTEAILESTQAIDLARARFEQGLDRLLESPPRIEDPLKKADLPTFYLEYHGPCNRHLNAKLARVFALAAPDLVSTAPHCREPRRRAGRIRIGFISQFMHTHSIGKVAKGVIAELNREQFEVYVLNIPPVASDDTTRWIQAHCDRWLVLPATLAAARTQIAELELDILFYQDIGMEPFSYLLAFARLAKVQCVSYGHPDTTGIPSMDYYVSNDLYETPGRLSITARVFLSFEICLRWPITIDRC